MPCCPYVRVRLFATLLFVALTPVLLVSARGDGVDGKVADLEAQRVAAIEKVQPSVVAIFSAGPQAGQGGGSGVVITKDGYALTNFHVVQGAGPVMHCGLPDGVLYDAVLVGLDKVGDVALIKLLPKEKGKDFPFAVMGDSDTVQAGDWSMAMGNPFLLATDFKPTVTYGLVSGIHRYQYPSGTLLEYTDCIQVDTSINPGNSGGPLFNMKGELIGINGRGSFDKRGRVNSGVGYAISMNQIKNFLGHLRAGIDTDHATLGAVVSSETDDGEDTGGRLLVRSVIEQSDVHRRGLDVDDELVSFAGRPVTSVNQLKNALGLYPKGWRVPLVYRRNNVKHEILARLMPLHTQEQLAQMRGRQPQQQQQPLPNTPAAKLYEPRPGYANYHFNKVERDRLVADVAKLGDFVKAAGAWTVQADADIKQKRSDLTITIREEDDVAGASGKPVVREWTYHLNPKALPPLPEEDAKDDKSPLRQAVRKAMGLLAKHAQAFPQEIFAKESEAQTKEYAAKLQKDLAPKEKQLRDALDALKKAEKERAKETSRLWQANFDYALARLSAFVAYAAEYNHLLGQFAGKDAPPRDPRKHRGWRMVPDEKIQDADAQKYAAEANRVWGKMVKDYNDTVWEDRAQEGRKTLIGLKWQPSGGTRTIASMTSLTMAYKLDPLKVGQDLQVLKDPPGSGGLLMALYQYRRLLTLGQPGFEGNFAHGGRAPVYPAPADPAQAKGGYKDWRVDAEVLLTEHAGVPAKWYFSLKDHTLVGFEVSVDPDEDPCEVYPSDYRSVDGRLLPHRFEVRYGNETFGTLTVKKYELAAAQ